MRNPEFKEIRPNYRRQVLEITLMEGRKAKKYNLPFAVFRDKKISSKNRFSSITIDRELGNQAASFVLEDGSKGDFPADFVLYYYGPTYDWSPINQLKRALKELLSRRSLGPFRLPSHLQFQVNHIAPRESQLVEKAEHIPVTPVDQRVDFCHADLLHVRNQLFHKRAGDAVMLVFRVDADRINPPDCLRHAVLPAACIAHDKGGDASVHLRDQRGDRRACLCRFDFHFPVIAPPLTQHTIVNVRNRAHILCAHHADRDRSHRVPPLDPKGQIYS